MPKSPSPTCRSTSIAFWPTARPPQERHPPTAQNSQRHEQFSEPKSKETSMDRADASLMSPQSLPERYVAKIFQEMQGNYGSRFLNQWKTGQVLADGTDAGIVN